MLLPCIKCFKYADDILEINIGSYKIKEGICTSCLEEIRNQIENCIMTWTLDYFEEKVIDKVKSPFSSIYVTESKEQKKLRFLA